MKKFLACVRKPDTEVSLWVKILVSAAVIILGALLGVFQKWLDGQAFNELPILFQMLDLTNFFGRFAIWILLATVIAVSASSPVRASINTFLFFISMVAGYYIYCWFVLGFFPGAYAMIWVAMAFASIFLAFICWYAKGNGPIAIIISALILGTVSAQTFLITQGFFIPHMTEVIVWAVTLFVLRRKPKEFAIVFILSIGITYVYQLFIPYWG